MAARPILLSLAVASIVAVCFAGANQDDDDTLFFDMYVTKEAGQPKSESILTLEMPIYVHKMMEAERSSYLRRLKVGLYEEALPMIDKLIKAREAAGMKDMTSQYALVLLRLDSVVGLIRSKRNVEAMVEALKARRSDDDWNVRQINSMLNRMRLTDYEFLQLPETASLSDVRKAYKRLALLIHPDKQGKLSAEEEVYLNALFNKVKGAFDNLSRKLN